MHGRMRVPETAGTGLVRPRNKPFSESPSFTLDRKRKPFGGAQMRRAMPYPRPLLRPRVLVHPDKKLQTSRCAMATSLFFPSSSSPHISILERKPFALPLKSASLSLPAASSLSASSHRTVGGGSSLRASERNPRAGIWRLRAAAEDALETSEQIVSSGGDDGVSTVVSVLLLIAFVGLSILTIGVTYIAVTDFLQKREREKFEKEEAGKKKKKGGKKGRVRARAGPRGFGQRIDEDGDD
ncbi:hypothetical protein ACJRO7_004966 [Eucalyptus globulus]|uniref:Transmembrane protein n=1 Tax=Eucalyptus globulus TaxID=34317 RepID=A0ABD3J0D6_EUCGL